MAETDEEEPKKKRGLKAWFGRRAHRVVTSVVTSQADALEDRARRVVGSLYEERADDLEDRAVRALRRAIALESERIRALIEHSVAVKKREVRLSLLVLVSASLVYLALYWLTK
ncbi:MAG: hypothetical protein O7B99_07360 [Planctomycetota bacterium]|nr:hypothetical protein [Planctomycetota bacterium]